MSEWQPIETAPRDDRDVILYAPGYGVFAAVFDAEGTADWWMINRDHQSERSITSVCVNEDVWPTHWKPLPDPPGEPSP